MNLKEVSKEEIYNNKKWLKKFYKKWKIYFIETEEYHILQNVFFRKMYILFEKAKFHTKIEERKLIIININGETYHLRLLVWKTIEEREKIPIFLCESIQSNIKIDFSISI